jgi:hypothetical protein
MTDFRPELTVIVPSRGRPGALEEMAHAFEETVQGDGVHLLFAVDADDPELSEYRHAAKRAGLHLYVSENPERSMVACLNRAARDAVAFGHFPYAIGFMGDDHRPRTVGWDTAYLNALRQLGSGIVYGDDLVQGERLPTQCAMTADVVRALGWMAPPGLRHMYVDNFWRDLGIQAGCLRYMRDVVVEHLHPVAGTAETDAGYERVNAPEVYDADRAAYREFCASGGFATAVAAVRALLPADLKRERHISMARASFVAEAAYITGAHTVADVGATPSDLSYLLGEALQVRSAGEPLAADVVCVTDAEDAVPALRLAGAAVVTAGVPLNQLTAAGFTMLRTRTIGDYPVALGVRR